MEQRVRHVPQARGLVIFTSCDRAFAASSDDVAGMLDAEPLAPLPGRGAPMAGVLAFRGSVVPTVDLAVALGAEEPRRPGRYAVVFQRGTDRFALLVEAMPRLVGGRDVVLVERAAPPPGPSAMPGVPGDVADPEALARASAPIDAGSAGASGDGPATLAVYDVRGERVEELDYWSLMDSVAPPAAFRLSGLGSR